MLDWAAPSGRTVAFLHLRVRVCEAGREDRSPMSPRVGPGFLLRGAMSLPLGHSVSRVLLRRLGFELQVKKGCRVGRAGRLRAFLSNPLNNLGLPRAPCPAQAAGLAGDGRLPWEALALPALPPRGGRWLVVTATRRPRSPRGAVPHEGSGAHSRQPRVVWRASGVGTFSRGFGGQ